MDEKLEGSIRLIAVVTGIAEIVEDYLEGMEGPVRPVMGRFTI